MRANAKAATVRRERPAVARRIASRSLLALVALSLGLLSVAGSASAGTAVTRPLALSLDGAATPQGQFFLPQQVAVDEATGTIYVGSSETEVPFANGLVSVFDSSGTYLSQIDASGTPQGAPLPAVSAIAVDNSSGPAAGNVYVATQTTIGSNGVERVSVFDSSGNYRYQFGGFKGIASLQVDAAGNLFVLEGLTGLTPDKNANNIYKYSTTATSASLVSKIAVASASQQVPNYYMPSQDLALDTEGNYFLSYQDQPDVQNEPDVQKLNSAGALLQTLATNEGAAALAFDPTTSTLFAGDERNVIEYGPAGFLRTFGGTLSSTGDAAVDSSKSRVLIADRTAGLVQVFGALTSVTVPDLSFDPPIATPFAADLPGTIDPAGVASSYRVEYRLRGTEKWIATPLQSAGEGTGAIPVVVELTGLRHGTEYDARLVAVSTASGAIVTSPQRTFATPTVPSPPIDPVTDVTSNSATFSGEVDPHGVPATWRFEYSTDHAKWTPVPQAPQSAGSGSGGVPVSVPVTGLVPNTTYFIRLVATYAGGASGTATSVEQSFTTDPEPPVVTARSAFPVTDTEATLRAAVDPRHSPTTYYFEYGLDESYGTSVPLGLDGDAGSGFGNLPLYTDIEGLEPETTYHFRLVADNQAGPPVQGPDLTFTTKSSEAVVWPTRGIELVTPPDKGNQGALVRNDYRDDLARSAEEGNVAWGTLTGVPGSPHGLASPFLAKRTPAGWVSQSMVPLSFPGAIDRAWTPLKLAPDGSAAIWLAQASPWGHWPDRYGYLVRDAAGTEPKTLMRFDPPSAGSGAGASIPGPKALSFSDDLQYVLMVTELGLDPDHDSNETLDIYDISDGAPRLVGLLPGEETAAPCGVYANTLNDQVSYGTWVRGSVAFFEVPPSCGAPPSLYARDLITGVTTLISDPAEMGGAVGGLLIRANADGSRAIFAGGPAGAGDIYLYEQEAGVTCLTCNGGSPSNAIDTGEAGRSAIVSDDLSHIYFASDQQLVPGEGEPPGASSITTNLYSWHDGSVDFISRYTPRGGHILPPDGLLFGGAESSANGETLLYQSQGPGITPDAVSPGEANLYLYREAGGESIECVSCVKPAAFRSQGGSGGAEGSLSGDGRTVVLQTYAALIPRDINQLPDIYEWRDGRLRLITSGATEWPRGGHPVIQGLSENGRDLIFTAAGRLTGHELDGQTQIYDARIGGGFPPPQVPPAPCVEDACQGPLDAGPRLASPASANFDGAANQRAQGKVKRQRKRQSGRCARRAAREGSARKSRKCGNKQAKKAHRRQDGGKRG